LAGRSRYEKGTDIEHREHCESREGMFSMTVARNRVVCRDAIHYPSPRCLPPYPAAEIQPPYDLPRQRSEVVYAHTVTVGRKRVVGVVTSRKYLEQLYYYRLVMEPNISADNHTARCTTVVPYYNYRYTLSRDLTLASCLLIRNSIISFCPYSAA
jgi:hypothetical protein